MRFEYRIWRKSCGDALNVWNLSTNTGGVIWLSTSTQTTWLSHMMLRSMQPTRRVRALRTLGYTAARPVETRLQSQAATHFRLRTTGSTILPTVRSGGSFWFIQCSMVSDKSGGNVSLRPIADIGAVAASVAGSGYPLLG